MSNLSNIDEAINIYERQISEDNLARQKAKNEAIVEIENKIETILGDLLWAELKPHAEYCGEWQGNVPKVSIIVKGKALHMVDFQLWIADHGNYELGACRINGSTEWLGNDKAKIGKFFKDCRNQYEIKRQEANKNRTKDLSDLLIYSYSERSRKLTLDEAKQIVAELCILDPDRASEWDELLHKWTNERQIEILRQEAEEKRKAEYEQIKAKFEEEYRAWFAKFMECRKVNIEKAENLQATYLDQLGKSNNFLLKYGASYQGGMEIMNVQVLEVLPSGDYKVYEKGQIKTIKYYYPISLQPIELTPEDRTWWRWYEISFEYDHYGPHYQLKFFYRPDVNIQTILKSIQFADPGESPKPPKELHDNDYSHIVGKIIAENR